MLQVTNDSLLAIKRYCPSLELLSVEGCVRLTDAGILTLVDRPPPRPNANATANPLDAAATAAAKDDYLCKLRVLNVSRCSQLSDLMMERLALQCRDLELLHLSHCYLLTDPGLLTFTTLANRDRLLSLDLSGCKGLTDGGFEVVGRALPSLTFLNLSSARITDAGMRIITHNCWKLQTLLMRDLYLISDEVFVFDLAGDGRRQVDENMLSSLTELDLTDCTRLTDNAVASLSLRCPSLAVLRLSGCSNMTDTALDCLLRDPRYGHARGQNLVRLYFAFCIQLTNAGLQRLCEGCEKLEVLDLSGCVHLTDDVISAVAKFCPHLQRLGLARCKRLTDRALCILADYLWIEHLDISHCNKVTHIFKSILYNLRNVILENDRL
jgi:F-box and leucine-rich repeat protein GRR1